MRLGGEILDRGERERGGGGCVFRERGERGDRGLLGFCLGY